MYPVGLCQHILLDASLHVCRWFLVGPVSECLGAFGFYLNVTKQAGFRSPWLFLLVGDIAAVLMYLYNKRGCYVGTCTI